MRIISGIKRGHKLFEFEGKDIRPTTDRVKESMFNLIQEFIPDAEVLDLFGGTGALSFEALSRVAKSATCVDIDKDSIAVIKKNAQALGFSNINIVNSDALSYISSAKKSSLVFLDPPYNMGILDEIMPKVCEILSEDGIIFAESELGWKPAEIEGLKLKKQYKYGKVLVSKFQKESQE